MPKTAKTEIEPPKIEPGDFFGNEIYLSPSWVGSSHWSIKKDLVANGRNFEDPRTAALFSKAARVSQANDENMAALWTPVEGEAAVRTKLDITAYMIADSDGDGVLFQNAETGDWAMFDRKYVERFSIKSIYGPVGSRGIFCNTAEGEPDFLLMSCPVELPKLPAAIGKDLRPPEDA